MGETFLDALTRELLEETGLCPAGPVVFLDSYAFGSSVGVAFAVEVDDGEPVLTDADAYKWIRSLKDLDRLKRVPGIDNHFIRACALMNERQSWTPLTEANLIESRYRNH